MPTRPAVLILSGKGGVGKTIVALNVAKQLTAKGKRVNLLDADIDNSNVLDMLGVKQEIQVIPETKRFVPLLVDGMEVFSMRGIVGDRPVSMRGTEYAQVLRDVVEGTNWTGDLFVVDLPASTGDEFKETVSIFGDEILGSIVVMQPAHVNSARLVVKLHLLDEIPVLGVIENMSWFECSHGEKYDIFGGGAIEQLCEEFKVPNLGKIPLSMIIRRLVQDHKPFLEGEFSDPISKACEAIMAAKPVKPGFLQRAVSLAKGTVLDAMVRIIEVSNLEIDLPTIQKNTGFMGGRIIELRLTDEWMKEEKVTEYFMIEEGLLKNVAHADPAKDPAGFQQFLQKVDVTIRIYDKALIWSFLGYVPGGPSYDFAIAAWSGKAQFVDYRGGTTQTAVHFFRTVAEQLRQTPSFVNKIKPLLEVLASKR